MPKARRQPTTKLLLSLLASTGRDVIDFVTFLQDIRHYQSAYIIGGSAYVHELKRLQNEKLARQTLRHLRYQRYVTARKIGQRLMISLTDKGQLATLVHKISQGAKLPQGTYLAVAFDIPVTENAARRRFRLLLRQAGFIKLQQSLWVSELDVYDRMTDFVNQHKLGNWVNVYRASNFLTPPERKYTRSARH